MDRDTLTAREHRLLKFSTEIGWQVPVIQMHAGDLFSVWKSSRGEDALLLVCVVDEFARIWEVAGRLSD
jgi:hypothetical protein